MKKGTSKYLHTMDGRPATWYNDHLIHSQPVELRDSLKQIRAEHTLDRKYRDALRQPTGSVRYSYVRIRV